MVPVTVETPSGKPPTVSESIMAGPVREGFESYRAARQRLYDLRTAIAPEATEKMNVAGRTLAPIINRGGQQFKAMMAKQGQGADAVPELAAASQTCGELADAMDPMVSAVLFAQMSVAPELKPELQGLLSKMIVARDKWRYAEGQLREATVQAIAQSGITRN